jgi:hypothetical protein
MSTNIISDKNKNSCLFETSQYTQFTANTECILDELNTYKTNILKKTNLNDVHPHYFIPDVFTNNTCDFIVNESEKHAKIHQWTTNRHKKYPTTDIPIKSINSLNILVGNLVKYNIFPIIEAKYNVSKYFLDCNDIFVVKYDSELQNKLEKHKDGSIFSFNVLLNHDTEFVGGGTIIYEDEKEVLVKSIKGGLLIHSGQSYHSGNEITKGIRYLLVGFVNYLKVYPIYNNFINDTFAWKIQSILMDKLYESIQSNSKDTYLLDINKTELNFVEKIVYDITVFHLNRLGKDLSSKKYYAEFWWKHENISHNEIVVHNYHYDKDEYLSKNTKTIINPMLSTITYLNNSHYPTIISNTIFSQIDDENISKKLTLSFPSKYKHICFDGKFIHGSSRVFEEHMLPDFEERVLFMINIWEDHVPLNINGLNPQELNVNNVIYNKDDTVLQMIDQYNIKNITLKNDIINKLFYFIKNHKHKLLIPIFQSFIDINKDIDYDFINLSTLSTLS